MNHARLASTLATLLLAGLAAPVARAQCPAPGAPTITLYSNLPTARGQTYIVAWTAASGLDSGASYAVERSPDPLFQSGLETFRVGQTSASLKSDVNGLFYHRVRAVMGCGTVGPASASAAVTIVDGQPVVIFGSQPPAVVRSVGDSVSTASFEVRNIGGKPFKGYLSPYGTTFFTFSDSGIVLLGPGEARSYTIEFYSNLVNTPGAYQGLITIQWVEGEQPKAYPWALVNLTVGPRVAARPLAAEDLRPPVVDTDFVSFQATTPSADPPPVTIRVTNPRSVDLPLGAETGPDGWLVPASGWNGTALKPGETRTVRLDSQRLRGQTGGIFPRYAYLTLRTKDGQATRVQFQDLDDTSGGPCQTRPVLGAGELSYVVPSAVTGSYVNAQGRTVAFKSRLLVTNVGTDPVKADLYFTPDLGDQAVDGYDCSRVLRASLAIPGSDVLAITDPLAKLFGYDPSGGIVSGTLEVRSAQIAQLRVDSLVDSPGAGGGYYGFQLPVARRGSGAVPGTDSAMTGLVSDATYRTNLILAETSGQPATVRVTALDARGTTLFTGTRTLKAYTKAQVNDGELFGGRLTSAASVTVSVIEGRGSVAALATLIDRTSQDAATLLARTVPSGTSALSRRQAGSSYRSVVASVVNGYNSKPNGGPFPYESSLSLLNATAQPLAVTLTYVSAAGSRQSPPLAIAPRGTLAYENVLREVFGITENSSGSLVVDGDVPPLISSRVFSRTDAGVFGDAIPVYPVDSPGSTSGATRRQLLADGFEHAISRVYGTRTNLILTEIAGQAAQVEVRLFEKGKERSGPIGTTTVTVPAMQKVQLDDVIVQLGAGAKDRTNVLCEVVAKPGSSGTVVAFGTRIDNVTADAKVLTLTPLGETLDGVGVGR